MKDINDQPQELLARYADRTGAKFEFRSHDGDWVDSSVGGVKTAAWHINTGDLIIRLVLDPVTRLPSHLKPYKENPRDPGDGWRVPTGEDVAGNGLEYFCKVRGWSESASDPSSKFNECSTWSNHYRLPATVMPPDWEEMAKEEAHGEPVRNPFVGKDFVTKDLLKETEDIKILYAKAGDQLASSEIEIERLRNNLADTENMLEITKKEVERQKDGWKTSYRQANTHFDQSCRNLERAEKAEKELAEALERNAQLEEEVRCAEPPTLRPISEMPADVQEGCRRYWCEVSREGFIMDQRDWESDTHFIDIRLPVAPDPLAEERAKFEAWYKAQCRLNSGYEGLHKECLEAWKAAKYEN